MSGAYILNFSKKISHIGYYFSEIGSKHDYFIKDMSDEKSKLRVI